MVRFAPDSDAEVAMRHWRKRWVVVLAGVVVLFNVLALTLGIYLQQAATRPAWASDPRKSYAQIFGVADEELARWFKSERFARLTKERVRLTSVTARQSTVSLSTVPVLDPRAALSHSKGTPIR
jgi:hypothetical protein